MAENRFPKILRELRIEKGLSLQQAADALNISKSYLWDLEKGRRRAHDELLDRIATFYSDE